MLSQGQFYREVPKSLQDNLRYRLALHEACLASRSVREVAVKMAREDLLWYVNSWCWTYRPKVKGDEARIAPFVTWEGQDEYLLKLVECVDRQKPLAVPKSRDAGASWGAIYVVDWLWRFHPYFHAGLSSRVGDLVDSKSPDSLFWKLRFVQKWLPNWMWPKGWSARAHDSEMHYENPETGSIVTGHPTTKDIGVAGRCGIFVFDEYARVPNARSVRDNTKDTADARIFISTHRGQGTDFDSLCEGGVVEQFILHWSQHPAKKQGLYRYDPEKVFPNDIEVLDKSYPFPPDYQFVRDGTPSGGPAHCRYLRSPWYDQECRDRSKADVRQNLDIDVAGGTSQFFDATLIHKLIRETGRDAEWQGRVVLAESGGELLEDTGGPLCLWLQKDLRGEFPRSRYLMGADIAVGTGATPSCLSVFDGVRGEKVGEYANAEVSPEKFASICFAIGMMFRDAAGLPAKFSWDASGATGKTFTQAFMKLGYQHVGYSKGPIGYGGYESETDRPGFHMTSSDVKASLLFSYAGALEKRQFVNPSRRALAECLQFKWVDGKVKHAAEKNPVDDSSARETHADRAQADMLAWMLTEGSTGRKPTPEEPEEEPHPCSWLGRRKLAELATKGDPDWAE